MEKKDKTVVCKECGKEFNYSVRDQEFYEKMGFNDPVRCKECRDKRNALKNNNSNNHYTNKEAA